MGWSLCSGFAISLLPFNAVNGTAMYGYSCRSPPSVRFVRPVPSLDIVKKKEMLTQISTTIYLIQTGRFLRHTQNHQDLELRTNHHLFP